MDIMIHAGVKGFLLKSVEKNELELAIKPVLEGKFIMRERH